MPMNEEVLDVLDRCDADSGLSLIYMERRDYATIRAELTRLTEIAESVDPLVIRLGEVTTRLEAAERDAATLRKVKAVRDEWARDAREHLNTFGQHLPASVECLVEQFDAATQEGEG